MNTLHKFIATAIAALVVLAAFFILFQLNRQHKHESERLSRTLSQTVQQLKHIETRSGQLAAEHGQTGGHTGQVEEPEDDLEEPLVHRRCD